MQLLSLFGPVDAVLEPVIGFVILALVLINMVTRLLAHRRSAKRARDGDDAEAISRPAYHVATNLLLMLATFYYLTLHSYSGIILSSLVIGLVLTDYFEFESLLVQVREGRDVEAPKASIGASVLVLLYIGYLTLFVVIKPFWDMVVV